VGKRKRRPQKPRGGPTQPDAEPSVVGLRIIGGRFRGRRLQYHGDLRTRPMKDRLREALFNLIGLDIRHTHAIDLFAGTGALALEAISRGAQSATLIEQHHPTAEVIRGNIAALGVQDQAQVIAGNVFIWARRRSGQPGTAIDAAGDLPADRRWAVFCSPPYEFYVSRTGEMLELISGLIRSAPPGSVFAVEADDCFDFQTLPDPQAWDVRPYPPAVVGVFRKE
jgi:16S rRNA (guanine966-N2)-methyltransferase